MLSKIVLIAKHPIMTVNYCLYFRIMNDFCQELMEDFPI